MPEGKPIQLYSDIGKSNPVFPKTNTKCVYYDDGTRLDLKLDELEREHKIVTGSLVTTEKIEDGAVTTPKIYINGNLSAHGYAITDLGAPAYGGDAANKNYVDGKHIVFGATISASGWQDWGNGYYAATVTANGLLPTDYPHITLNHSKDTIVTAKEEYSKIMMAWADTNLVAFLCYEDTPTIDLNILVEVNR